MKKLVLALVAVAYVSVASFASAGEIPVPAGASCKSWFAFGSGEHYVQGGSMTIAGSAANPTSPTHGNCKVPSGSGIATTPAGWVLIPNVDGKPVQGFPGAVSVSQETLNNGGQGAAMTTPEGLRVLQTSRR